ncbi:MAG: carboxypeptidase-like regulatory domain-containing protein, partial [Candidatus Riflebacteria bacterium]|nr:carboxypeptidase-like regulatory domain-containing protein [Candidatus Riflebacteria bacterium]
MVRQQTTAKGRWLLLIVLSLASIVFTGCEKGSLGIKGGSITGFVINASSNQPVPDVLIRASGPDHANGSAYTSGDGSFVMNDLIKGDWTLFVEKYGYSLVGPDVTGTQTANITAASVFVANGETVTAQIIKMNKTEELVKGVLKAYPIDGITGRPLTNFTVTQTYPYNQRKSKLFETAADFRDIGWSGLEGGNHHYTIAANNYTEYSTTGPGGADQPATAISIGASPVNLGTIKVAPLTVNLAGTLRNLPGYILEAESKDIVIWAEAAGKVVATFTDKDIQNAYKGSVVYKLDDIPVTAGSVAVKCKIRGYDLQTINQAVNLASNMP